MKHPLALKFARTGAVAASLLAAAPADAALPQDTASSKTDLNLKFGIPEPRLDQCMISAVQKTAQKQIKVKKGREYNERDYNDEDGASVYSVMALRMMDGYKVGPVLSFRVDKAGQTALTVQYVLGAKDKKLEGPHDIVTTMELVPDDLRLFKKFETAKGPKADPANVKVMEQNVKAAAGHLYECMHPRLLIGP